MKTLFVAIIVALAVAGAVVLGLEYDPGYVLIALGEYTLEMTFWVGLIGLILLVLGLYTLFALIRQLIAAPRALNNISKHRRHDVALRQTDQGIIAFAQGNWARSERLLVAGAEGSDGPLLNWLLAARAANRQKKADEVQLYLQRANALGIDAEVAIELTRAEIHIANDNLEMALAKLRSLRKQANRHPWALALLKQVYLRLGEWRGLTKLLPQLLQHELADEAEIETLRRQAAIGQLKVLGDRKADAKELNEWWMQQPREIHKNADAVNCYVRQLRKIDDQKTAEKIAREYLKRDWSNQLVHQYGVITTDDPRKHLMQAESWLKERNSEPALYLALGRLSLQAQEWPKAKEYLEYCYRLERSAEVCAELGRLLNSMGETEAAQAYFAQGLLASQPLPDLPQPEPVGERVVLDYEKF